MSGRVNEQTRSAEATRQVPSPPGDPCASQRGGDFDKRGTRQSHVCKALCAPRRRPRGGAPGAGVCVPVAGLTPVRSEAFRTSRVGVTSCQDREQPPPGATCRSAAPLPPSPSSVARRRGAWPVQVCGDRPLSPVRAGSQFRGGVGAQSGRTLFSRPRRARESGRGASALRSLLSLDEHPFSRARSLSLFSSFASSPAHLNSPRVLTYKRTALREEGVEPDVGSRVGERVAAHVSPERARPVTRGPLRLDSGMPLSSYLCTWRY